MKQQEVPVFIDPTTDVGFKRLFGDKKNLINFLNIIFRGRKDIVDLTYRDTERVGTAEDIGTVIFDLMVETGSGEQIVIEMQTTSHSNLKKRMLYYASKVISDEAPRGNRRGWAYALPEVYTVVLMNGFHMPESSNTDYFHDICLCSRDSGEIFYEGLGFIYLELINFEKSAAESKTDLDKVFFMLKNMSSLKTLPRILNSEVFRRFFQLAKYAKLTKEEQRMYDISLKRKWDAEAVRLFREEEDERRKKEDALRKKEDERLKKEDARIKAEASRIQEEASRVKNEAARAIKEERAKIEAEKLAEKLKSALNLKKRGLSVKEIAEDLGLTVEQVEKLK